MTTARIQIDGLWRCLCPAINHNALRQLLSGLAAVPRSQLPACKSALRGLPNSNTSARQRAYTTVTRQHDRMDGFKRLTRNIETVNRKPVGVEHVERQQTTRDERPTSDIYDALASLRTRVGSYGEIVKLVDHLVYERGVQLDAFLYETLLIANADPKGSASAVKHLLNGMRLQGIQKTPATYIGALRALAVHPDYVLRGRLLDEMRMLWVSPSSGCQEAIALGLLRDGQHELALDLFEELIETGSPSPWLYEIFIYAFSEAGFHDEALSLLRHQARNDDGLLSAHVWFHVLESCSRAFHYPATAYIWSEMVTEGGLIPPDGTVLGVINTASRFGDVSLATDALRTLSNRNAKLAMHHFEALLDTYVSQGDVVNAVRVLCIMAAAGNEADSRSTQPLFRRLVGSPESLRDASKALVRLTSERAVPLSAFNVVLEATVISLGLGEGMNLYRSVRQICRTPPNLATFTILLGCCDDGNLARFLVKEMESFSIVPDQKTYELLVRGSTLRGDTDLALDYISEMSDRNREWWVTEDTADELVERGILGQNPRIWPFIEASRGKGIAISTARLQSLKDGVIRKQVDAESAGSRP